MVLAERYGCFHATNNQKSDVNSHVLNVVCVVKACHNLYHDFITGSSGERVQYISPKVAREAQRHDHRVGV